ncbi:hypothetical protein FNV43_RR22065 [Rhamnella rubrinervis]|uniref:WAT1-related protein n=1 Tax=Rhamnella rubrinervis TaxID=2594499 RepID=A0A8K0DTK3_9ROSA|nr:hypothetical protein FNV43_RR22065 [Rhamnella rubrinervis]
MEVKKIYNCRAVNGLKAVIVMVATQIAYAVMNILYKLAVVDGMDFRILVAYRLLFASAVMLPVALFFEWKSWEKLDWVILFQAFLCGLLGGSLSLNLYIEGLALTTVTYVVALSNLIPAITFVLAICFRLEKLAVKTKAGMVKVGGTVLGICGAMIFTFYRGTEIDVLSTPVDLLPHQHFHVASKQTHVGMHLLGSFLAFTSSLSYALWLIVQTKMSKRYPFYYSSTALMCIVGLIQSLAFALCMERDWNKWKLGWNIRLLTVTFSGIVTSGVVTTMIAWCVHKRGPLFVAIFNPLGLVMVGIAGSLFLEEKLHLGSLIGGLLIVCGLYMVLWGKAKEMKRTQLEPSQGPQETQIQSTEDVPTASFEK